nr:TonB-dependent receptor [Bacteroidota bacterium]
METTIFKLKNSLRSVILLITMLLLNSLSYSQTTGSIGGSVVDASDKSSIVGAIIKIENSNQGAESDINGEFVILNVDVGTYTLEASYIGYRKNIITNVKVSVDKRIKIDFLLTDTSFATPEIEIIADRSGIEVYQSGIVIETDRIENTGLRGISNIVSQTAGVVQDERGDAINIRGGRDNETQIIIDGMSTNNPIDGTVTNTNVANSLIQEITVLTGGFGAEYGNALSGVINVTTKSGTKEYSGSIEAITDEFAGDWMKTTSQGYNLYNVSFGGPLIPTEDLAKVINFYGGVERQWLQVRAPSWISDKLFPEDKVLPNDGQDSWFYSGRLNINISQIKDSKVPINLRFGALISENNQRRWQSGFTKTNSYHNPFWNFEDKQFYGRIIHEITSKFFYELQGSYFESKFERGDPFFRDNLTFYGDTNHVPILPIQGAWTVPDPNTGNVFQTAGVVYPRYEKNEI